MKLIRLKCQNCNANLEMDYDRLLAYCPYCGEKLLIDDNNLGEYLSQRELTKRDQIRREYIEKEKIRDNANKRLTAIGTIIMFLVFIGVICAVLFAPAYIHKQNKEIKVGISAKELKGQNNVYVKEILREKGFTNIQMEPTGGLLDRITKKDGEVASVSISGNKNFKGDEYYPYNTVIRITYYALE